MQRAAVPESRAAATVVLWVREALVKLVARLDRHSTSNSSNSTSNSSTSSGSSSRALQRAQPRALRAKRAPRLACWPVWQRRVRSRARKLARSHRHVRHRVLRAKCRSLGHPTAHRPSHSRPRRTLQVLLTHAPCTQQRQRARHTCTHTPRTRPTQRLLPQRVQGARGTLGAARAPCFPIPAPLSTVGAGMSHLAARAHLLPLWRPIRPSAPCASYPSHTRWTSVAAARMLAAACWALGVLATTPLCAGACHGWLAVDVEGVLTTLRRAWQ